MSDNQGLNIGVPKSSSYLTTSTLLLMAIATGLCAGANYFNQPLLNSIALSLGVSEGLAATTVTLSQAACCFLFPWATNWSNGAWQSA